MGSGNRTGNDCGEEKKTERKEMRKLGAMQTELRAGKMLSYELKKT